jgi:hypothetical protein
MCVSMCVLMCAGREIEPKLQRPDPMGPSTSRALTGFFSFDLRTDAVGPSMSLPLASARSEGESVCVREKF